MTNMAQNWSFHTQVTCPADKWLQQSSPQREPQVEGTRLLAFIASECTTQKASGDGMQHGAWLDPARGKVAINWGMSAAFATQAPAVVDFYYSTATPNDYFVSGEIGAGMGFAVPPLMPDDSWQALLEDAVPLWGAMDLSCMDIYANDGYYDGQADWPHFAAMCEALGLRAVTFKNRVRSGGVLGEHGGAWGSATELLQVISYPASPVELSNRAQIDFLFDQIAAAEGPWGRQRCCVYLPIGFLQTDVEGGTAIQVSPSGLLQLQQRLDAELGGKVRLVRLDEMLKPG